MSRLLSKYDIGFNREKIWFKKWFDIIATCCSYLQGLRRWIWSLSIRPNYRILRRLLLQDRFARVQCRLLSNSDHNSMILMIICLITVWNHRKIKKKLDFYKTYNFLTAIELYNGNTTDTNMSATSSTWWSTKSVWQLQCCTASTVDNGTERTQMCSMIEPQSLHMWNLRAHNNSYKDKINSFW